MSNCRIGVWRRIIGVGVIAGCCTSAFAQDAKAPILISIVTVEPVRTALGELMRENQTHIELVDLKTGQLQTFAKADLKTIRKDISERTAIDTAGLPNYMAWRVKKVLPAESVTGKVAQVDGPIVFVSLGKGSGIEEGKELTVYRGDADIKDPDSGLVIGKQRREIGRLEITDVQERLSKAKLLDKLETALKIGDIVEPTKVANAVAILPLVNPEGNETVGSRRIAEELTTGLVNRDVRVVERRLLDKVLGELGRQQGAVFDAAKSETRRQTIGSLWRGDWHHFPKKTKRLKLSCDSYA